MIVMVTLVLVCTWATVLHTTITFLWQRISPQPSVSRQGSHTCTLVASGWVAAVLCADHIPRLLAQDGLLADGLGPEVQLAVLRLLPALLRHVHQPHHLNLPGRNTRQ